MFKTFFTILFSFFLFSLFSQAPVGKLFILNEGAFGGKGAIGVADFQNNTYTAIDTNLAAYGNQISYINGQIYAVDGNGDIWIYNAQTYAKTDSIIGQHARTIFGYNNQLLICTTTAPYFRSLTAAAPHNLVYQLDATAIRSAREELVIINDKAYISGFNSDSIVSVVDLTLQQVLANVATRPNPFKIITFKGKVYAACYTYNANFTTNTELIEIDPLNSGVAPSWFIPNTDGLTAGDTAIYMRTSTGKLLAFNPLNSSIDSNYVNINPYGLHYDKVKKVIFYTQTDYVSTGLVGYTYNNQLFATINTAISPRSVVFLPSDSIALANENPTQELLFSVFPNPIQEEINVFIPKTESRNVSVRISDLQGRILFEAPISTELSTLSQLSNYLTKGIYFITVSDGKSQNVKKIIKQ